MQIVLALAVTKLLTILIKQVLTEPFIGKIYKKKTMYMFPIDSLPSILSNVFEKIFHRQIQNYFINKNLLIECQYG